jgi:hypothetical protein
MDLKNNQKKSKEQILRSYFPSSHPYWGAIAALDR